jgi:hypothetical protein
MRKYLWIMLILTLCIFVYFAYPSITGLVVFEEFDATADVGDAVYKGGGFELYSYSIEKTADSWELKIQGQNTRWIRFFDRSIVLEIQVWNCDGSNSLLHRGSNYIGADGLFTINTKLAAPQEGKLRVLLHSSGASIDIGYNLKDGQLLRGWSPDLLKGIREAGC